MLTTSTVGGGGGRRKEELEKGGRDNFSPASSIHASGVHVHQDRFLSSTDS